MTSHDITTLLRAWSEGDQAALDSLIPLVDPELRRVARGCLVCAQTMRRTLVDHARARRTAKRGGGRRLAR